MAFTRQRWLRDQAQPSSFFWSGGSIVFAAAVFVYILQLSAAHPGIVKASEPRSSGPQRNPPPSTSEPKPGFTKVAEGEYAVVERASAANTGPFEETVFNFRESWTLWRGLKGAYRVQGVRTYEAPQYESHSDSFTVDLSRDLVVLGLTDFAKLKWVPDSGPLSCQFLPSTLHCSGGGSDPKHALQLETHLENPYGLLWPVSPFSLSGIAREIERDPQHPSPVELLSIEQPSPSNPVATIILKGRLAYLGEEDLRAAGRTWKAHKFSLKVALHPQFLIWTSPKGLLLALALEHEHKNWPEEGLRLVRFSSSTDF